MSAADPGPLPSTDVVNCGRCEWSTKIPVPIIGEPANAIYVKLFKTLADHLQKKHRALASQIIGQQMACSLDYSGILILSHFSSLNEDLGRYRDTARHRLHDWSRKTRVSDATIEERVGLLALDGDKAAAVTALLKEMRDVLEERGLYPEDTTTVAGSPILVA